MSMPSDLQTGYRSFREHRFAHERERYLSLAKGQKPRTMIIACADSRVDPATIFSAAPGELYVVRNVAALVPPCEDTGRYHGTSAALEFAVTGLQVENIVVMGHGMCGGVAAALARHPEATKGRITVTREGEQDAFELAVETTVREEALAAALAASVQAVLKLRGGVRLVEPGALPNDGKVIDDRRAYDGRLAPSALARLVLPLHLVDHVDAALAAHDAAVLVPRLQRPQRVADLHPSVSRRER